MTPPWRNERLRTIYQRPEISASVEIILSVFAVASLLFLAIRPTLGTVATLQKKIEDQEAVGQKLDIKILQLVKAQSDLNSFSYRLPDYSAAVTDSNEQGALAKRVELLASENGLIVNNLSFGAVPLYGNLINLSEKEEAAVKPETIADGRVALFTIRFDVSGDQNKTVGFLSKLENMDRVVLVSSTDMKKTEIKVSETEPPKKGVRTTGTAYSYYSFSQLR